MARQGRLILPAPEDAVEFAAVIVDPPVSELLPKISVAPRSSSVLSPSFLGKVRLLPRSLPSLVLWQRRHDLSVEPGPNNGGHQIRGFPQSHDGLAALVKNELHEDRFTGTVFVFRSRKADRLKLIYWDGSGIVMAYKWLEEQTFTWPGTRDGLMTLTHAQFEALFADSIGGGFTPFRQKRRKPSISCGEDSAPQIPKADQLQLGSFHPCLMPPTFPMMLPS